MKIFSEKRHSLVPSHLLYKTFQNIPIFSATYVVAQYFLVQLWCIPEKHYQFVDVGRVYEAIVFEELNSLGCTLIENVDALLRKLQRKIQD